MRGRFRCEAQLLTPILNISASDKSALAVMKILITAYRPLARTLSAAKKVASVSWPNDSDCKRIMGDSDIIFVPFEKRAICRSYTLLCLDPTGMILYGLLV